MTPSQIADVFAFIEQTGRRATDVYANRLEFADIITDASLFVPYVDPAPFSERDPQGTVWGANVWYAEMPLRQVRVEGRSDRDPDAARLDLFFEILDSGEVGPDFGVNYPIPPGVLEAEGRWRANLNRGVRPLVEPVDMTAFAQQGLDCHARIKDIRDHAALYGHRFFTIDGSHHPDPTVAWRISCGAGCGQEWRFTMDDIAASGRFDLADRFGWGAEIESIKLMPHRERPTAWGRIGAIGDDE